jgi:hypothetical protein
MRWRVVVVALVAGALAGAAAAAPTAKPIDAPVTAPALGTQQQASIAFDGTRYLAVWLDGDASAPTLTIRAARLSASGDPVDAQPIAVASGAALAQPAVAFDGSRFVVTWLFSGQKLFATYVDGATATVAAPFQVPISSTATTAVVAGGGGSALVGWIQLDGADYRVHAALYTQSATTPVVVSSAPSGTNAYAVAAAWGGAAASNYLLAWQERPRANSTTTVHAARVSAADAAVDAELQLDSGSTSAVDPSVASDGQGGYLAAWMDRRATPFAIYARLVPSTGTPAASDFVLAHGATQYWRPQLGFVDGGYLAVWESYAPDVSTLFGGRVTTAGALIDGAAGIAIAAEPPAPTPLLPDDGSNRRTAVASDGATALTVWTRGSQGVTGDDVYVLPTDGAAPATTASKLLGRGLNVEAAPAVAANANELLVVWQDGRNAATSGLDLYGMRFALDGTPLDAAPFVVDDQPGDQFGPSLAADTNGDFLVAWADARNVDPAGDVDLYATIVGSDGKLRGAAGGFAVSRAPMAQLAPSVTRAPGGWLVAWEDWQAAPPASFLPWPGLQAALVSAGGTVAAPVAFAEIT